MHFMQYVCFCARSRIAIDALMFSHIVSPVRGNVSQRKVKVVGDNDTKSILADFHQWY